MAAIPLKPNDLIIKLRDALKPYAQSQKGILSVASDPYNLLEILGEQTPGFRIILLWEGDEDVTQQALVGIVSTTIAVVVSHNRGLRIWRGESNVVSLPGQKALLERLDEVRTKVRKVRFETEASDEAFLYLSGAPEVTPEGLPLDAYRLRFRIHTALTNTDN